MTTKSVPEIENAPKEQMIEDVQDSSSGLSINSLTRDVEHLCTSMALSDHLDLFKRAVLVAQQPRDFESISGLSELDKGILREEISRKWHHPKKLWFTIGICSLGAAVHGWDQTGSNGANLFFPDALGIGSNSARDKWLVGLINSAPTIAMCLIGAWCSDLLNSFLGRRGTLFVSAIFSLLPVAGSALAQTWPQLFVCRLLLGIGMGIKMSTAALFAAECAPAHVRGALTMSWQLWVALGILLGMSANLAVYDTGKINWRLQLGSAMIPAIPLLAFIYVCPESPRWLMKKGHGQQAFEALKRLRNHELLAARDLCLIRAQLNVDHEILNRSGSTFRRFVGLFNIPRVRRANVAAGVVMISQQLCGINIIAFYSSTIFVESGASQKNALWASWGFGLVQVVACLPAIRLIDSYGRRSLLLSTFPHMAWTLLAAGLCFLIPDDGNARLGLLSTFIFLFGAVYCLGEGPVCFPYAAEVYPLSHREMGMAWSVVINTAGASVLSLTFPYMLEAMTPLGAFGFYCGLNVMAFFLIFFLVPETKMKTLEELDYVFSVPMRRFMHYQTRVALPWWLRRWVLWRRDEVLEPLALAGNDH
ncbi:sugar transporter domain-containing protein [Sarocladium implicatum]|nr:sugar transporter domain-containing protein [Sarocladium implicatum]